MVRAAGFHFEVGPACGSHHNLGSEHTSGEDDDQGVRRYLRSENWRKANFVPGLNSCRGFRVRPWRVFRLFALIPLFAWAGSSAAEGQVVRVLRDARHDVSRPLRSIPPRRAARHTLEESEAEKEQEAPAAVPAAPSAGDPLVQRTFSDKHLLDMPAPNRSFEGIGNINGFYIPDTSGAVGPSHYVQWVLTSFQIFDKNGNSLYGPAAGNTLWAGFGGPCETRNDGDPIVLYDAIADRWFFSQYTNASPYGQCVAVSRTPDPLGAYNRYFFSLSNTVHYDYPKFGVWPDGYYMTGNRIDRANGGAFVGTAAVVFDRAKMLSGQPATFQEFSLQGFSALPADFAGPRLPPAGSPGYFVHVSPTSLDLYRLHVDWTTPGNSVLTGPTSLPAASYNVLCPTTTPCVPQPPPGVGLDALGLFPMQRFAYRNLGDHESFVFNLSVDTAASAPVHAGVRWYEVRNAPPGGSSTIYQQGTYAPDALHRWMGSAAMDAAGDIAVGYSVSDGVSVYPGIRYTGRLATDPLGTLPQGEVNAVTGSGAETGGLARWGDYSTMSVDPSDGCTFWYTSEYMTTTDTAPWRTRVVSFKFPGCAACTPPPAPSISGSNLVCVPGPLTLTATGGYTSYQWYRGAVPLVGANSQTYSVPSAGAGDAGTYYVTGTSSSCVSAQSPPFPVSVNPIPPPPVASNNGPACAGSTLQLTASGPAGANYSWTGPAGFVSTQQNPQIVSATPANSGTYSVTVSIVNGCPSSAATTTAVVRARPSASVTAAPSTCPDSSGNFASVPFAGPGAAYAWGISNGTITGGSGTPVITFRAGSAGSVTITVTVTDANGCSTDGNATVALGGSSCGVGFYTIAACRVIDTRLPNGSLGGPALASGSNRNFGLVGACGIPATARAVSANVTVTSATGSGDLRIFPGGTAMQIQSVVNFAAGKTRSNNTILPLGAFGDVTVFCEIPNGTVGFILDVDGYFQ